MSFPSSEYINVVVAGNEKHLIKDLSDSGNWECHGTKDWNLIMLGSYYSDIKSTFTIMEKDLQ